MNQLHPVYHGHSHLLGSRIDIDRVLPSDLKQADLDDWIEKLCEPPTFIERIAPISTVIDTEVVRGKNWTDLMMRSYRVFLRVFSSVRLSIRQALAEKFGERGFVPYMSCDFDPDTLHSMVKLDYEQGENSYGSFMEFYRGGVISPCVTVPFHAILSLLDNDFDRRLCIRIGLLFYWRIIKEYHKYVRQVHGETDFVVPFWLPECGFSNDVAAMIVSEFQALARADRIPDPHLVLMLDSAQAVDRDNDVLMKSWNRMKVGDKSHVWVIFRDRSFSDWVTFSNPSVKKLIDRTIAKVDSALNVEGVDYCWSHYEDIEALTFSAKSTLNFEQKIVKLAQLSYLTMSPDFFIRRKINGKFGKGKHEPQEVRVRDNTSWTDWHPNASLGRWQGVLDSNAEFKLVDENQPYVRRTRTGKVQEIGPQCWKIAFNRARTTCTRELKGDPHSMKGGFLEILAETCGAKEASVIRRNVSNFLLHYTYIYWREHFLQHELSEADCHLEEVVDRYLMKDVRKRLKAADYVRAGVAAQGYYFALDCHRSHATFYENMDQRAVYQACVMLTLAFCNLIGIYHWQGKLADARKLVELIKTELLDFPGAFRRYRLADFGVTEQEWTDAMKSAIEESPMNIVERAVRRTAARHLRPFGYRKEFSKEDEHISTNCGHIWSAEIENSNYKMENKIYCGLREE